MLKAALGENAAILAVTGANIGLAGQLPATKTPAPALSWQRISVPQTTQDLTAGGRLEDVRMQVDVWGVNADQAAQLADLVRGALTPSGSTGIARFASQAGPYLEEDSRLWRVRTDYFIWQERD